MNLHRPIVPGINEVRAELLRRSTANVHEQIAKEGILSLHSFVKLGWSQIEPARKLVDNWHLQVLSSHLEAISNGEINRLVINVPPGMMKSLSTSVFWNAWEWGPRATPSMRYIGFSWEQELAIRDALRTRRLIQSTWYQMLWGDMFKMTSDQNLKSRYENDKTGFRIADYVGAGTGERADRCTIDDPHLVKAAESEAKREGALMWLSETLPTRMTDPDRSAIVLIMQRIHEQDMTGDILQRDLGYEYLMLPMEYEPKRCSYTVVPKKGEKAKKMRFLKEAEIWVPNDFKPVTSEDAQLLPQFHAARPKWVYKQDERTQEGELLFPGRFSREVVERDKKAMTEYSVAAQFQQRPTVRGGSLIKRHWFEIVKAIPQDCYWVRRWDLASSTAASSAFTAGVLMGRSRSTGLFYVRNVVRGQLAGDDVKRLIKQTCSIDVNSLGKRNYQVWLPQDPGQAGKVQAKDFMLMLAEYNPHTEIESGDKITRAEPFAAQAQAGNVKIVEGDWNEAYLRELAAFSEGAKFKDQVDASSGAFGALIMAPRRYTITSTAGGAY